MAATNCRYQPRIVSQGWRRAGATVAGSSFRPSRLPISASAVRSGRDSRGPGSRWAFRTRFSTNRYSFFRSSSWLTRPVTKVRRRATLEIFGFKLHRSKPRPISAFEYFGYTTSCPAPLAMTRQLRGDRDFSCSCSRSQMGSSSLSPPSVSREITASGRAPKVVRRAAWRRLSSK